MNEIVASIFSEQLALSSSYADKFVESAAVTTIKKNDFLIIEGTICNFIGILISGTMRSFVQNESREFNNDFHFPYTFVSAYNSFLTRRPNYCNIQALSDAEICTITYDQLNNLVSEDFAWLKLGKYISEQFYIRKCERESSLLQHSALERLDLLLESYPGIEQKVSQYHIASYLGIKPETLSRIKLMKNNNLKRASS